MAAATHLPDAATPDTMVRPSSRSEAIDLMRGVSILWVVGIWHVLDYLPEWPGTRNAVTYPVTVAFLGLFTLISGFLMGRRELTFGAKELRDFYVKRFGRIYPPFAAACLVFALIGLQPVETMLRAALLIAMLDGPAPTTLWFITMIVLFYAITPFLLTIRKSGPVFGIVAVLVSGILMVLQSIFPQVSPRLAMYFPAYAVGLWLGKDAMRNGAIAAVGLLLAPVGLWLALSVPVRAIESSVWSTIWAVAAPVAIFGLLRMLEPRIRPSRIVAIVAAASYFLYLLHRVVYAVLLKLVHPADPAYRAALIVLVALPIALTAAYFGQRAYDNLWQRLTTRRARVRTV